MNQCSGRSALNAVEAMTQAAAQGPDEGAALAAQLAAFLHADATHAAKVFVSRQLVIVGTDAEARQIAALLYDSSTADLARYAHNPKQ